MDALEKQKQELDLARQTIEAQAERIAKLEHRLEIDVCYDADLKEKVIAPKERDTFPDGIYCRDATIELMKQHITELEAELDRLREEP